mmetsp:Transcript_15365/g.28931  ORF Transcript_15365/g.28931 Transcript_15365/m.28931 type:complete len:270 (+) Transcript_15365:1465-2274(+)
MTMLVSRNIPGFVNRLRSSVSLSSSSFSSVDSSARRAANDACLLGPFPRRLSVLTPSVGTSSLFLSEVSEESDVPVDAGGLGEMSSVSESGWVSAFVSLDWLVSGGRDTFFLGELPGIEDTIAVFLRAGGGTVFLGAGGGSSEDFLGAGGGTVDDFLGAGGDTTEVFFGTGGASIFFGAGGGTTVVFLGAGGGTTVAFFGAEGGTTVAFFGAGGGATVFLGAGGGTTVAFISTGGGTSLDFFSSTTASTSLVNSSVVGVTLFKQGGISH